MGVVGANDVVTNVALQGGGGFLISHAIFRFEQSKG